MFRIYNTEPILSTQTAND